MVIRTVDADDGTPRTGRSEFKYTVTERAAREMAHWAQGWTKRDLHVHSGMTDYTITSLYLDTPDWAFLWAKRTLQHTRVKARLRTYGRQAEGIVFAELKRRFGEVMVKSRVQVDRRRWPGLLDPSRAPGVLEDLAVRPAGRDDVTDFVAMVCRHALRPVVLIRYEREPFVGLDDRRARLTFDRCLRARPASVPMLGGDDAGYRAIDYGAAFADPMSQVVVELKFDGVAPMWMQDLVYRFGLIRTSFSKYGVSMDVLADQVRIDDPARLRAVGWGA